MKTSIKFFGSFFIPEIKISTFILGCVYKCRPLIKQKISMEIAAKLFVDTLRYSDLLAEFKRLPAKQLHEVRTTGNRT